MAPLSIPVTAELMYCWASGNRVNGTATHKKDKAISLGQSSRSTGLRARGTNASVAAPEPTRSHVINPGAKSASAMEMKRERRPPDQGDRHEEAPIAEQRRVPD